MFIYEKIISRKTKIVYIMQKNREFGVSVRKNVYFGRLILFTMI